MQVLANKSADFFAVLSLFWLVNCIKIRGCVVGVQHSNASCLNDGLSLTLGKRKAQRNFFSCLFAVLSGTVVVFVGCSLITDLRFAAWQLLGGVV